MPAGPIDELIAHFAKLPGIGERTATRLAFHLLRTPAAFRRGFMESIQGLDRIHLCSQCSTVTDVDPCTICRSPLRDRQLICVVEKPSDIYTIERLHSFTGVYHVLHGLLSPMEGISAKDLRIRELLDRFASDQPRELILALSPTVEGDATASYLVKQVAGKIPLSRLASGLPIGADLEFADQITLGKAFEARTSIG